LSVDKSRVYLATVFFGFVSALQPKTYASDSGYVAPMIEIPKSGSQAAFRLADYRGRVVLVDFWASWCGPCLQALPRYEALWQELHASGFEVIGIDVDQHPRDGENVLGKLHLSYPQVADPQGRLAELYGVNGMPSSYLIDRKGQVRQVHVGFDKNDIEPLRKVVAQLVEEK